ncbi:MAG: DUF4434 domain-containing protein [Bacteroidales bacterium]|nr:DUF4434 domain-containing protein [Bacteroidales bacterium]
MINQCRNFLKGMLATMCQKYKENNNPQDTKHTGNSMAFMVRSGYCKSVLLLIMIFFVFPSLTNAMDGKIGLTLIPPTTITNKTNLDIRAGLCNTGIEKQHLNVQFYINHVNNNALLYETQIDIEPKTSKCVKFIMSTVDKVGLNKIILEVKGKGCQQRIVKQIEIINSEIRSTRTIDGAWIEFYHWSETEGKKWNLDIKKMTDSQWKELVMSMHKINMDIIVLQESFRNEMYVDNHHIDTEGYNGKAYYPSTLYPSRMPITANDPIEAVLSQADKLGMHVFVGVGMYAWFDFTNASCEWHKNVAKELWEKYGNHSSFYGWYISEENSGGLDAFSTDSLTTLKRHQDIISFFKSFKQYCASFAPDKPIMLATNSSDIVKGEKIYPELLKYVDILCPFGFARMPEGDLTGEQAALRMQNLCNDAKAHLWLDLEAFLFHREGYLYPRPMSEIMHDLTLFDNFEKVLCYQYTGVFNDPKMSIRIGEKSTIQLFLDYQKYLKQKFYKK